MNIYRWLAIAGVIFLNKMDKLFRNKKFENEQWFLDWQDELNEISVR